MVEVVNLKKSFNNNLIFDNLNLKVDKGEFLGIVGRSGRGKTTLLNIIGTLENIDSGTIKLFGKIIDSKRKRMMVLRNEIGFVFQNYALIDNLSVKENLNLSLKYKKISRVSKKEKINTVLEELGLQGYENKVVHTLSGGEQQRVAIARLILKEPALILADEPTGSLDRKNRDVIVNLFQKLNKEGKTIIMVTHDEELIKVFSRTIEL